MKKKIHIIGGAGSGKTYISKKLSKYLSIPLYELDNFFWSKETQHINGKVPDNVRDEKLNKILKKDSWIIEGVFYSWLGKSFSDADVVFIIKPNIFLQNYRIIKRFIKRKLGLEKIIQRETFKSLIQLIKWNHKYNQNIENEILTFIKQHSNKIVIIKNNEDILNYFSSCNLHNI